MNQEARVEETSPQLTVGTSTHEITETLNVLVNDGSRIGSHTLDLTAPPKLTLEITLLPPLSQKLFLRDLHSGKVKQISYSLRKMSTSVISVQQWSLQRMKEFSPAHQWTRLFLMRILG